MTETTEERTALNNLVASVDPQMNQLKETAANVRRATSEANSSAISARANANYSLPNMQGYLNSARYDADRSRHYANECRNTANRWDYGDDQRSNNDRSNCETHYNRTKESYNTIKGILDNITSRRSSAWNSYTNVNSKLNIVNNGINSIRNTINAKSGPLFDVIKKMTDYGNDHNFDWLYAEIARITPLKNTLVDETLPGDIKEEKAIKATQADYQKKLDAYIKKMQEETAKGSFADQTNAELKALELELKLCTDKIDEYKKTIGETNSRIGILSAQFVTEQTNLTNAETNKKNKFDEMNKAEKRYNDLSGELIKLQTDKSTLEGLISSEELKYIELKKHIEILNKKIIDLNIQDYGTKVYNNEKLLELNQTIDKDLQSIFSHLKTENINPDLLYTKTKYRVIEEEKLSNINKLLDVLFYCFYFSFIIIRIVTRNTQVEDFLMYILVGIIPLIYPFLYKNTNYVIHLFHLDINKNAFIESEVEPEISIDAYNI